MTVSIKQLIRDTSKTLRARHRKQARLDADARSPGLATKRWRFTTPLAFPHDLLTSGVLARLADPTTLEYRTGFELEFSRLMTKAAGKKRSKRYDSAWKSLMRRSAVPYMLCARGLYGLKSLESLPSLVGPQRDPEDTNDEMSVSMNVFAASAHFAQRRRSRTGSSALIIYKFPTNKLVSFGGDSESGALHEAELKARACWKCVDRIYVLSRKRVGTPVGTKEREEYGLSAYLLCGPKPRSREARRWTLVTALPLSMLKDVRRLGLSYDVTRAPPKGWKWYRVR